MDTEDREEHPREPSSGGTDPDQAWFWTASWQEGERRASRDIEAGRTRTFEDEDSFLASLLE
jgi:hypothetical protein